MDKIPNRREMTDDLKEAVGIKRVSLRQIVMSGSIILFILYDILQRYVDANFDVSIYKDPEFWITLALSNISIIAITLIARSSRKDYLINNNEDIKTLRKEIAANHKKINTLHLMDNLKEQIAKDNFARKKQAYRIRLMRRAAMCGNIKLLQKKKMQLLAQVESLDQIKYDKDKENWDILDGVRVRYDEIRVQDLFSGAARNKTVQVTYAYDDRGAVGRLLVNKAMYLLAFSVLFRGLALTAVSSAQVLPAIIDGVVRVVQAAWAYWIGAGDAEYCICNIFTDTLRARNDYLKQIVGDQPVEEDGKSEQ